MKRRSHRRKAERLGFTRRQFLKMAGVAGAGLYLPLKFDLGQALAYIPGGSLDPTSITKYAMSLVIPPAMPKTGTFNEPSRGPVDYYEIAVKQFSQQILPSNLPATTVWSYGSVQNPETFNYPAFTMEARFNRPVRVKWVNGLVNTSGNYLPHLLPVEQAIHWANPAGGTTGRDSRPTFTTTPGPYTGPVPMVPHLHGGHSTQEADGYAEAWYLPNAGNIPAGYATVGSYHDYFHEIFQEKWGQTWQPGTALFQYDNDQRASTLWYHDHTLGMTRLNVYAGPAGFYLIRRGYGDLPPGALPGPAPGVGDDPFGRWYEIPIAIQDRSFNENGSLFYPTSREFFDGITDYVPETDVPPIWNPEFFGNTMVVNGRTWPHLEVEQRRYRLRLLNGCNARFLILKMVTNPLATRPATPVLPFWQIGTEGGFLPKPVVLDQLLMSPAERADVIVDFTNLEVGTEIYLINEGPDEPFGGGIPETDFPAADPHTTGQIMKFTVVERVGRDRSVDPETLGLPNFRPIGAVDNTRQVSLNETMSQSEGIDGPIAALLGTMDGSNPVPMMWDDPITESVAAGDTEVWEMYNFTEDAHPIHIHEIMFQVVNRETFDGDLRNPEQWESGLKDTVIAYPGEITRVKGTFDLSGRYVWHCHIVEHEDNEMMRPYEIG
jgi:bilirubin oxidase